VQPTIETNESSFDSQSYHCSVVKKIGISGLDPSLAFGFFCKTESEFQDFVIRVEQLSSTLGGESMVPFSILKKRPDYDDSRDIFGEHEVDALTSIGDEDFVSDLVII
jgi:cysteine protease ATG4